MVHFEFTGSDGRRYILISEHHEVAPLGYKPVEGVLANAVMREALSESARLRRVLAERLGLPPRDIAHGEDRKSAEDFWQTSAVCQRLRHGRPNSPARGTILKLWNIYSPSGVIIQG